MSTFNKPFPYTSTSLGTTVVSTGSHTVCVSDANRGPVILYLSSSAIPAYISYTDDTASTTTYSYVLEAKATKVEELYKGTIKVSFPTGSLTEALVATIMYDG